MNSNDPKTDPGDSAQGFLERHWSTIILILVAVILAAPLFYAYTFGLHVEADHEKWGQFGDYFGGVLNPMLAFLSFTAIIYTLKFQIQTNRLSKSDLDESNRKLIAALEAIRNQYQMQKSELFELHFFQSIGLLNSMLLNSEARKYSGEKVSGHSAFELMFEETFGSLSESEIPVDEERIVHHFRENALRWQDHAEQAHRLYSLLIIVLADIERAEGHVTDMSFVNSCAEMTISIFSIRQKYFIYWSVFCFFDQKSILLLEKYAFFSGIKFPMNFRELNRKYFSHISEEAHS